MTVGIVLIALAGAMAPARQAAAQAAAPGTAALNGVLLLRNGSVLVGAVRRSGDDYLVDANGATLQVRARQVERFATSLDEVYEARRSECNAASAEDHLALAAWCLQLNMLDQAARELLDARTIDPQLPALASLEAQLQQIANLEAARRTPVDNSPNESPYESPDKAPTPIAPSEPRSESAPDISTEAQIQFVRSIQPMLIRNCSTGGCHQKDAAQRMHLDRWALEGSGNAEIVRRNLSAVLLELDRDDPSASAVLNFGRTMHGRATSAGSRPLTSRQAELLLEWLNAAAGIEPMLEPVVTETDPAIEAAAFESTTEGALMNTLPNVFAPRDAFDPEIFNRRQAGRRAAREADAEAAAESLHEQEPPALPVDSANP